VENKVARFYAFWCTNTLVLPLPTYLLLLLPPLLLLLLLLHTCILWYLPSHNLLKLF